MADLISVEFSDGGLRAELARIVARLDKPRELLGALGGALEGQVSTRFETKTDPEGSPWDALRPSTEARYARRYAGNIPGTLLDRSGSEGMLASLTSNVASDTTVEVGMNKPYALFHEFGTNKMARRGFFFADPDSGRLGDDDLAELEAVVVDFLDNVFGPG